MEKEKDHFDLEFQDGKIHVERMMVAGQTIYRVHFSDHRAPLVIVRALGPNATKFWTSVPEGRQKEAMEVGAIISRHYKATT